jgi:trehalose-phosphatase
MIQPLALERWPEIAGRLAGRRPALFLDYDGTLSPIVQRPELALLAPAMQAVLRRLAGRMPVAILTGRLREDAALLVGLPQLYYAGSHGRTAGGRRRAAAAHGVRRWDARRDAARRRPPAP